jgi:hypothetical protein
MTTDWDTMRRRCQALVDSIEIPVPYSVEALCQMIAQRRGRPIRITALPPEVPAGNPCGGWIPLPATDVILVEERTSQVHREQIILHELAHMLCGHADLRSVPDELTSSLLQGQVTHLSPAAVQGMLARSSYDEPAEEEAELVATLMADRIAELRSVPPPLATSTLRRITHVFGGPPPSGSDQD